jgi:YVTN family beta-propeller protein
MLACGGPGVKLTEAAIPPIQGRTGSFDALEIDQSAHRLYLADRTGRGIDVFDVSTPNARYLKTVRLPAAPNGLALAADLHRVFAGTDSGAVAAVDTDPGSATFDTVVANVSTGGSTADLLDYAATRQRLYVSNGPDGTVTSIDPTTNEVKAQFQVGYALEQPRFNPADNMVYVTSTDGRALFQVDPNDGKVKNRFSLDTCTPAGLAINPGSGQALIACNGLVVAWDLRAHRSSVFGDVPGGDLVSYDASIDRFFVASPHVTTASLVGIFGGSPPRYLGSVTTNARGKSAAYDETNRLVYTPDSRPNQAALMSFPLPAYTPPAPEWLVALVTLSVFTVPLILLVLGIYLYARRPKRTRATSAPAPRPAAAVQGSSPPDLPVLPLAPGRPEPARPQRRKKRSRR